MKSDVVGAADAGFQHAAAPHRYSVALTKIVNALCDGVTANASHFDVDNATSAEFDSGKRLLFRVNALVQTDGGLQALLQLNVAVEIVPAERLLDHHQMKRVELLQHGEVAHSVGGIGIHHEPQAGKLLAQPANRFNILPRLDLDFDALIASFKFHSNGGNESFQRFLNPNRDTGGNFPALASQQFGEWNVFEFRLSIPYGSFQRRFSHVVTADVTKQIPHGGRAGKLLAPNRWPNVVAKNMPGGVGRFGTIGRHFAGHALSPASCALDVRLDQKDAADVGSLDARLKRGDKRHVEFAKRDFADAHRQRSSDGLRSYRESLQGLRRYSVPFSVVRVPVAA